MDFVVMQSAQSERQYEPEKNWTKCQQCVNTNEIISQNERMNGKCPTRCTLAFGYVPRHVDIVCNGNECDAPCFADMLPRDKTKICWWKIAGIHEAMNLSACWRPLGLLCRECFAFQLWQFLPSMAAPWRLHYTTANFSDFFFVFIV